MLELLNVNPSSGDPIYRQLHEQIVRLIVSGQLAEEDVLPSVRQIAEALAVNPMTVSRAIQQLVDQGYLERRRGQATRVAARSGTEPTSVAELLGPKLKELIKEAQQLGMTHQQLETLLKDMWQ